MDAQQRRLMRAEALIAAMAVCESPDDFGMLMVTRVFAAEGLRYAVMFDTDGTTELRRIGGFGDPLIRTYPAEISIWSNINLAHAFRENRVVRVNDADEYRDRYQKEFFPPGVQGGISMPLREFDKTMGAMVLVFKEPLNVHAITDEEIRLVQSVAEHVMRDYRRHVGGRIASRLPGTEKLTERQVDILNQLAQGKTVRETAGVIRVSEATIKAELQRVYRSFGVSKKRDAIAVAVRLGLLVIVDK